MKIEKKNYFPYKNQFNFRLSQVILFLNHSKRITTFISPNESEDIELDKS